MFVCLLYIFVSKKVRNNKNYCIVFARLVNLQFIIYKFFTDYRFLSYSFFYYLQATILSNTFLWIRAQKKRVIYYYHSLLSLSFLFLALSFFSTLFFQLIF